MLIALPIRPGFGRRLIARRKRGLALFDVILALGIIGALTVGAVLLLQTVQERTKRNDTLALINIMRSETSRIYAGHPTLASLSMGLLEGRGSLPDAVIRTAGSVYEHAYDGAVAIWPIPGKRQFVIGLDGLDDGPCGDIVTAWANKTRTNSGLVSMAWGNTVTFQTGAPTLVTATGVMATSNPGITAAEAATNSNLTVVTTWCSGGAGNNDIYLHFQS